MFDIGWTELLIVVVVAVVVVGPKDLPKMMRLVGRWTGRARAMADQFRRSFEDMARQAELEEMRSEVMKLHNDKTLAEIQRETDIMLGNLPPDPEKPLNQNTIKPSPGSMIEAERIMAQDAIDAAKSGPAPGPPPAPESRPPRDEP